MLKILHISKYYNPHIGGIESTCENIVRVLKTTKKYKQHIVCFGNEDIDLIDGIPVTRVRTHLKVRSQSISVSYTHKLRKTIKEFKPDVVLFHAPNPFAARSLLKCRYKGKLIVFHHADIVKQKILKKIVKPYITALYKKANKIIVTSQNYLDNSEDLANFKDKCTVIPLSYRNDNVMVHHYEEGAIEKIRNEYKKPIAIFTGRHVEYKGLEYAIRAFNDINDMTFLVAGVGPLSKKLRKMAENNQNIHFIGMLSHKLYRLYLNSSDFFLFPSHRKNEAFGISLVEALAAGKPAITFKVKGSAVNWINLDGITGIECENENIAQLTDAINKLKTDESLRLKLGENAKNRTRELFSYEKFKTNILDFFEKL